MGDREALLAGVYENFADHTRKLIYADYVEERDGEPGELYAQHIRKEVGRGSPYPSRDWELGVSPPSLCPEFHAVQTYVVGPLRDVVKPPVHTPENSTWLWEVRTVYGFPVKVTGDTLDEFMGVVDRVSAAYPHAWRFGAFDKWPWDSMSTTARSVWRFRDQVPAWHPHAHWTLPSVLAPGIKRIAFDRSSADHTAFRSQEKAVDAFEGALALYGEGKREGKL